MPVKEPVLTIRSKSHDYTVTVQESFAGILSASAADSKNFYLVDSRIRKLYARDFESSGIRPERMLVIEATEQQKSYENLTSVFESVLKSGFRRDNTLIVIGGGVVQDIGCFICSVLFRGVRWELVPTTLLAQCDSCIGAKSSINIGSYKNQIGTFYPPHQVHLCFSLLKTLPADEIRSGLGEIIKLGLIAGGDDLNEIREGLRRLEQDPSAIGGLVLKSLQIKKRYIEEDEFDRGIRNLLNYGHTFGHAYESATHYGIPHGIAVTLGMTTATFVSERLGMIPAGGFAEMRAFLKPYFAPYERKLLEMPLEKVLSAMKLDKKNTGGKVNCILTRGPGKMEKTPLVLEEQLQPLIREFLAEIGR